MPYIEQVHKLDFDTGIQMLNPENEGELNYIITRIAQRFLVFKGLRYANINAAIGALECAKLELYRRIGVPYEDNKINANGDVLEPLLEIESTVPVKNSSQPRWK